jgi:hypothetical protein
MLSKLMRLFTSTPEYRFDFSAAKRSARIILIDDDRSALPMDDLTRDGCEDMLGERMGTYGQGFQFILENFTWVNRGANCR